MRAVLEQLWSHRAGATAIEYAMIVLFIALLLIVSLMSIGTSVSTFFTDAANGL